jgi:hypothetical protein
MEQSDRTPIFTDAVLKSIADSLPEPLNDRRRKLLPQVLREWCRTDLREHLSREPRAAMQARISSIEKLKAPARDLIKGLDRIDQRDRVAVIMQMIEVEGGRRESLGATELAKRQAQMSEVRDFLAKLASMESRKFFNLKRGQPRNLPSYLVLLDAAAIFNWYTGDRAARGVDRIKYIESGPFFRFASALWPFIFGKGIGGLPAAMKNWAKARKDYAEHSALIENIAWRHSTWGVFER